MRTPSRVTTREKTEPVVAPYKLRPHFLQQNQGPGSPKKFELARDSLVVGREPGVDILLASEKVSRRHALLRRNGNEYSIIDLDSANGIFLNSIKVYSAVLRDGDLLQLADAVFLYHEG
jgi:pSer/pThr/pTyr-binding forkhead associated (FHA) protein